MSDELHVVIGEHNADIATLKQDIKEIKENQKAILAFITEQTLGRKYIWMLIGGLAAFFTFAKDILSLVANFFKFN